jgi:hypothetical protein
MLLSELEWKLPVPSFSDSCLAELSAYASAQSPNGFSPIRFAVVGSDSREWQCEVAGISESGRKLPLGPNEVFRFEKRKIRREDSFNAVVLVPTGIGAEIGGHAGDAGPMATLLAAACDKLITHPNVVNASDIIQLPENGVYVEGSVLCRLLMGTVGLEPVRSNRLLVILDKHFDRTFTDASINSINAARATYGLKCSEIVVLDDPLITRARYANSGRAAGRVEGLENLLTLIGERRDSIDAVAISTIIDVPEGFHDEYFKSEGSMVNPWGGIEALLTHAVSYIENLPSAHSPMMESKKIAYMDVARVDPRMAAEAVSMTFINCILKGLQKSPRVVTDPQAMQTPGIMTAADISCLVIPDGCLGLPTLAALEQGIPVIAVRENRNVMRNDLSQLPWSDGQFHCVENYWEAAGVMLALKAGIDPGSVRRPMLKAMVREAVQEAVLD